MSKQDDARAAQARRRGEEQAEAIARMAREATERARARQAARREETRPLRGGED